MGTWCANWSTPWKSSWIMFPICVTTCNRLDRVFQRTQMSIFSKVTHLIVGRADIYGTDRVNPGNEEWREMTTYGIANIQRRQLRESLWFWKRLYLQAHTGCWISIRWIKHPWFEWCSDSKWDENSDERLGLEGSMLDYKYFSNKDGDPADQNRSILIAWCFKWVDVGGRGSESLAVSNRCQ